jgi:hypothetical protein
MKQSELHISHAGFERASAFSVPAGAAASSASETLPYSYSQHT